MLFYDRLSGLVVRVPDYRSRGPRIDSRHFQIFWEVVDLERDPLSLVSVTEELFEWKSTGFGSRNLRLTAVGNCKVGLLAVALYYCNYELCI
jgi:hypothetical protein